MELLSDIFIENKDSYTNYNGIVAYSKDDCFQARYLTPLELAGILKVLTGDKGDIIEIMNEFKLLTEKNANQWIYSIPERMADALIALSNSKILNASEKLAQTVGKELGLKASDFVILLTKLKKMSERTKENNKLLFHWMSL